MLILPPEISESFSGSGDLWARLFAMQGEVYREEGGRRTLRFSQQGQSYFLKTHQGIGWKEIFKNLLQGKTPVLSAVSEWNALNRLQELGISSPVAIGVGCRGHNPAARQSFLLTKDIGQSRTLEEVWFDWRTKKQWGPDRLRLKRALIREVARIAATLHAHGLNHRDLYLCHFRIAPQTMSGEEGVRDGSVYLMDLHRAQIRSRTPLRWIIKDLGALLFSCYPFGITRSDRLRFIKVYTQLSPREAFKAKGECWARVERRALRMYRKHGAPQLAAGLLTPSIEPSVQ